MSRQIRAQRRDKQERQYIALQPEPYDDEDDADNTAAAFEQLEREKQQSKGQQQ